MKIRQMYTFVQIKETLNYTSTAPTGFEQRIARDSEKCRKA